MNKEYRKSLLAGTIAALVTLPVLSAQDTAQTPGTTDVPAGQSTMQESPQYSTSTQKPMDEPVRTEAKPMAGNNPMLTLTPDDLHRKEVVGSDGETIGKVSDVVSGKENGDVYAVISTGGFLGLIGGSKHVVPLNELRLEQDKLHIGVTQEELSAREKYTEEHYLVVKPDDRPIIEFSAFEQKKEQE